MVLIWILTKEFLHRPVKIWAYRVAGYIMGSERDLTNKYVRNRHCDYLTHLYISNVFNDIKILFLMNI